MKPDSRAHREKKIHRLAKKTKNKNHQKGLFLLDSKITFSTRKV